MVQYQWSRIHIYEIDAANMKIATFNVNNVALSD